MSDFVPASERAQQVVEAVSGGKLRPETHVAEVTLWGVRAVLTYRLDEEEHARRREADADPLDDLWLLDALLKLPVGRAVPLASLASRDQRLLKRGGPVHACEWRGEMVERLAVPPLCVDMAVVRSERVDIEALNVMPFGAYAPQAIWLDCPASGSAFLQAEAARFSTGVVHWQGAGEPQVMVPVEPLEDVVVTAAGWQFAEHAYAQVLGLSGGPGLVNPLELPRS